MNENDKLPILSNLVITIKIKHVKKMIERAIQRGEPLPY